MRSTAKSLTFTAADVDLIGAPQNPANLADLLINGAAATGGVATLDASRKIVIISAADDSLINFTIYGTNENGIAISEVLAGANIGTATSVLYYKTITRIASSGNPGSLTVGTSDLAVTDWIQVDHRMNPFLVGFRVSLSSGAALTYSVEHTLDNIQDISVIQAGVEVGINATVATETTEQEGNYVLPIRALRLATSAFTSGTATITVMQAG